MGVPGAVGGGILRKRTRLLGQPMLLPPRAETGKRGGREWGGGQHLGCTSQSQAISLSSRRDLELQPRSKMLYAAP